MYMYRSAYFDNTTLVMRNKLSSVQWKSICIHESTIYVAKAVAEEERKEDLDPTNYTCKIQQTRTLGCPALRTGTVG